MGWNAIAGLETNLNDKAGFSLKTRNPDILTSIANLSNDEVFTPPILANKMLDDLATSWAIANDGADIWSDSTVTFLDPTVKSGVFLREITRRLGEGLSSQIPDIQARINHILTKQVFGVAITELTSLLARRSVYCSKWANGKHSIATEFDTPEGNVWFDRTEHSWSGGRTRHLTTDEQGVELEVVIDGICQFCGAKQIDYARGLNAETHAYPLIHTNDPKQWVHDKFGKEMKFDVIVGNPPYQLDTGGSGGQARPTYQHFVEQAKKLEPKYLTMVIPSRWFSGGMGLGEFRQTMLFEGGLVSLTDFLLDKDAFPGVNINGGVCYFLWEKDHVGDCLVTTVEPGGNFGAPVKRQLGEFDVFVRRNEAVQILRKVKKLGEPTFEQHVLPIDPFGFPTKFHGRETPSAKSDLKLFGSGKTSWIKATEVTKNRDVISKWKVFIPRATDGNEKYPLPIWNLSGPFVGSPNEVCSWTYLVTFSTDTEGEAKAVSAYMGTKFFRFLVSLRKVTQDNKSEIFSFVPVQDFSKVWMDEELYAKYGFSTTEVELVENLIRPLEPGNE